jgi:hypothetical protein
MRMLTWLRALRDWRRRQVLAQHAELGDVPFEAAWARYSACHREARRALDPWYWMVTVAYVVMPLMMLAAAVLSLTRRSPASPWLLRMNILFVVIAPAWGILTFLLHRRLRRRIVERIAAERELGRLPACLHCGYDLRGAAGERCPECGKFVDGRLRAGRPPLDPTR